MKTKAVCLIIWMIITLILTFSVIGMLLFIGTTTHYERGAPDIVRSSWMQMGYIHI
jgi:hypothetical protein